MIQKIIPIVKENYAGQGQLRQPSDRCFPRIWSDQFYRVSTRVSKVDRFAARGPIILLFYFYIHGEQSLPPKIQVEVADSKRHVAGTLSAVPGDGPTFAALGRIKEQKHSVANSKENVSLAVSGVRLQVKQLFVKCFSFVQIVHINGYLHDIVN